jgi:ATP-dependent NAD(P)H-hydrate dehydratase
MEPGNDVDRVANSVAEKLSALHALIIGPGLGRDRTVLSSVSRIISSARNLQLPLVVDGDGLWLITQDPELVKGYSRAILTPNAIEYSRLCAKMLGMEVKPNSETQEEAVERTASLASALGNVTVLRKGEFDVVSDGAFSVVCATPGGLRRCSGQGDILAGTVGLFSAWTHSSSDGTEVPRTLSAALAGCVLTRTCSRLAFQKHHRSVTTTKLIEHISECFDSLFELESVKREYA